MQNLGHQEKVDDSHVVQKLKNGIHPFPITKKIRGQ